MQITDFQLDEALSIPADWRRVIGADCPVRRCPLDVEATVQRWLETHGADVLLQLGLLQQDVDDLAMTCALRDDHGWLQPHVDPDSDEVVGISTAGGLLMDGGLSIARSLEMAVAQELRNEPAPRLFFCSDVRDLAVLASLGYVVRPIDFLSLDRWCELEELYDSLGWRDSAEINTRFDVDDEILLGLTDQRRLDPRDEELAENSLSLSLADSEFDLTGNIEIVFVGWSPAALTRDLPTPFLEIVENLKQLQTVLGRDLSNVAIWRPDNAMLNCLRFVLNRGTAADVRSTLETSLRQDRWSLEGFVPQPVEPPNLLEAFLDIERQAAADSGSWQRALAAFLAAETREVIEPLLEDSSNADPSDRCLQLNTALLQSTFVSQWCQIQRSTACGDRGAFPTKDVSLLLATTDRLLRSFKARKEAQ